MIRFGLVGLGNIGKVHVANFAAGKIGRGVLSAVSDLNPPAVELPEGTQYFDNVDAMLESGLVDAVIVATPHPLHRTLGEKVLAAGLHLMMEKPLTASKLEGERLLAFPRKEGQVFGLMMNVRTHPLFGRIKELLGSGELGALQRVQWTITNWFRPEAYYSLSEWRATWKGEGGGVLINQALHNLDVLCWLCGLPASVQSFCRFGQEHDIEVEDDVVAYLEYPNGASGLFTTTTGEAPGVNRLEIACTGGLLVMENDVLRISRNSQDIREYSRATDNAFGAPDYTTEEYVCSEEVSSHAGVLTNFVDSILDGAPLMTEAKEGLNSVELANAILYSTWTNSRVEFPLDSAAYEAALAGKIATTPKRKRVIRAAKVDMDKSYS